MKLLIADDEVITLRLLEATLLKEGHQVIAVSDGEQAWEVLQQPDAPSIAILDWVMPGLDGVEICRRARQRLPARLIYLILLTARGKQDDIVAGLEAGADDYLVKPFNPQELRARVQAGVRLLELQHQLTDQARELEAARTRLIEQERFNAAVSAMSDGIVTTGADWHITTANHAACLLLDLPEEGGQGAALNDVLAPFTLSVPWQELQTTSERVTAFAIDRPHTQPPLLLEARLTRVLDGNGRLISTVLVVRDATEERQARKVQTSFINAVSHKLRTPLALLNGYLELCKRLSPEERLAEWEEIAHVFETELKQLGEMVQKLLELKGMSEPIRAMPCQPVEVASLVAAACEEVRQRYPTKRLEIGYDLLPGATHVRAGAAHVGLVLGKLLDNAAKFGDKEPICIHIQAERVSDHQIRLSVMDNGPGIPHEYRDRVLEPFVQVEDRVTGQVPGLGIGLYMARRMVEAYGGQLAIRSRLGEGTTVSLTLPAG